MFFWGKTNQYRKYLHYYQNTLILKLSHEKYFVKPIYSVFCYYSHLISRNFPTVWKNISSKQSNSLFSKNVNFTEFLPVFCKNDTSGTGIVDWLTEIFLWYHFRVRQCVPKYAVGVHHVKFHIVWKPHTPFVYYRIPNCSRTECHLTFDIIR